MMMKMCKKPRILLELAAALLLSAGFVSSCDVKYIERDIHEDPEVVVVDTLGPSSDFSVSLTLLSPDKSAPTSLAARLELLRGQRGDYYTIEITSDGSAKSLVSTEGYIFLDTATVYLPLKEYSHGWHKVNVHIEDYMGFEDSRCVDFYVNGYSSSDKGWMLDSLWTPKKTYALEKGESVDITADWYPAYISPTRSDWSWKITDSTIVSVSSWGQSAMVTALKDGKTQIVIGCRGAFRTLDFVVGDNGGDSPEVNPDDPTPDDPTPDEPTPEDPVPDDPTPDDPTPENDCPFALAVKSGTDMTDTYALIIGKEGKRLGEYRAVLYVDDVQNTEVAGFTVAEGDTLSVSLGRVAVGEHMAKAVISFGGETIGTLYRTFEVQTAVVPTPEVGTVVFKTSERKDFAWVNGSGEDIIVMGPTSAGAWYAKASGRGGLQFDFSRVSSLASFTPVTSASEEFPYLWDIQMKGAGEGSASVSVTENGKTGNKDIPVLVFGNVTLKCWCSFSGITKKAVINSMTLGFEINNTLDASLKGRLVQKRLRIQTVLKDETFLNYEAGTKDFGTVQMPLGESTVSWSASQTAEGLLSFLEGKGVGLNDVSQLCLYFEFASDLNNPYIRMTYSGRSIEKVNAITAADGVTESLDVRIRAFTGIEQ